MKIHDDGFTERHLLLSDSAHVPGQPGHCGVHTAITLTELCFISHLKLTHTLAHAHTHMHKHAYTYRYTNTYLQKLMGLCTWRAEWQNLLRLQTCAV